MTQPQMKIIYEHDGSDILESAKISEGLTVNNLAADVFQLSAKLGVPVSDISMRFSVHDGSITHKE